MLFRNYTPFPPLQFESRDEQRRDFGVVVLRGTFRIVAGEALRPIPEQAPLVMADQYFGEPINSSLHFESNLAPYKPRTDIHVIATAHAPGGRPAASWLVSVEVGSLRKELRVTGPRSWKPEPVGGWSLTDPLPVLQVPIRYESAYGGRWVDGERGEACESNPAGVGFYNRALLERDRPIPAPQIVPVGTTSLKLGEAVATEGLGPIAPAWLPRRSKAGTFNVVWEKTRWPDLPEDFSFEFYNSAAPGLVYPGFVKGDESVTLVNLSRGGTLAFRLPGFELAQLLRFEDGQIVPAPIVLDSIHLEVEESRAYLTWRGIFPLTKPLRVLEVRMRTPQDSTRRAESVAGGAGVSVGS